MTESEWRRARVSTTSACRALAIEGGGQERLERAVRLDRAGAPASRGRSRRRPAGSPRGRRRSPAAGRGGADRRRRGGARPPPTAGRTPRPSDARWSRGRRRRSVPPSSRRASSGGQVGLLTPALGLASAGAGQFGDGRGDRRRDQEDAQGDVVLGVGDREATGRRGVEEVERQRAGQRRQQPQTQAPVGGDKQHGQHVDDAVGDRRRDLAQRIDQRRGRRDGAEAHQEPRGPGARRVAQQKRSPAWGCRGGGSDAASVTSVTVARPPGHNVRSGAAPGGRA